MAPPMTRALALAAALALSWPMTGHAALEAAADDDAPPPRSALALVCEVLIDAALRDPALAVPVWCTPFLPISRPND